MKRFLLSLALVAPLLVNAQRHHEVGIFAGASNYRGDLQDKWFPEYGYKPNVGLLYKYFMNPRVGIRLGMNYTKLTAADSLSDIAVKQIRNLRFETNLFEMHAGLEINLLGVDLERSKVSPYIFGGLSVFYFDPYTDGVKGEKVMLRPLSTEGQGMAEYPDRKPYSKVNVAFPFGGGLKFFIGRTLMITTELGLRYTATDYLDDVSRSYVDYYNLMEARGEQSVDLSYRSDELRGNEHQNYPGYGFQRGDSKANDWYLFGGLGITVYFDAFSNVRTYWQSKCPGVFGR
ncbi:MAG TPA: DUF6089 family protein [Flavipsychrobacter sp.]|nr:DUF6089 family protein [Flavipsychrobacter sp.]